MISNERIEAMQRVMRALAQYIEAYTAYCESAALPALTMHQFSEIADRVTHSHKLLLFEFDRYHAFLSPPPWDDKLQEGV